MNPIEKSSHIMRYASGMFVFSFNKHYYDYYYVIIIILIFLPIVITCAYFISKKMKSSKIGIETRKIIPKSVNYHFTRKCNYNCGFCFHTAKTSYMLKLEDAKRGLKMLKKAGMEKVNFSGGEPFLPKRGRHLGQMVQYCKNELKLAVSIISNGSLITEEWFKEFGEYVDIMAVSCESFNEDTNQLIGRGQGRNSNHLNKILQVKEWCEKYKVLFKINTVVNTYNKDENMSEEIEKINPIRWKVFQCLLLEGENAGPDALRNAEQFYISKSTFEEFLQRHSTVDCLVPESNEKMKDSYLILDEYMRFLDCTSGSKIPSKSILDVGVENALQFSGFDEIMFKKRGGLYKWSKEADRYSW